MSKSPSHCKNNKRATGSEVLFSKLLLAGLPGPPTHYHSFDCTITRMAMDMLSCSVTGQQRAWETELRGVTGERQQRCQHARRNA